MGTSERNKVASEMDTSNNPCCYCKCHQKQVPVTLRDTFFQDPFFSRRWDEFDQMRKDMISESRQAWQKIDEEMQKLEQRSLSKSLNISSEPSSSTENTVAADQEIRSNVSSEQPISTMEDTVKEARKENIEIPVQKEKTTVTNFQDNHESQPLLEAWFSPIKLVKFPSLFGDDGKHDRLSFFKEENVIKIKDDDKAFEITMDTSQYRPDELNVNVIGNNLSVEAKHTEQSEDGRNFVSKQIARRYTLPNDCKAELVSSNLSADGVLVISAPKYPAITEIVSGRNVPILRA